MQPIVETVPNFSEGRNREVIEAIVEPFRSIDGVKLLDYSSDPNHNRLVVTAAGRPEAVKQALLEAMTKAVERIDLRTHRGQHPRMGAVDVVPFIPVKDMTMADAVALSKELAAEASERLCLPVFLYEESASAPHRRNLADIRKGQFEGMAEKLFLPEWHPDYGPGRPHPTAGVTAVGARMPLIAYNINLGTDRLDIAQSIARSIRHISGGLRYCKALGVRLEERNLVQVSMNLTDYTRTALYRAFELVRIEAERWGVPVVGSEIVGLVPLAALVDAARYYLRLEDFSENQILETRLWE
uniref:glutamate formimidoyltransferase n=1 Tax=Desulfatirhabdium butyrativorans TaxID=340467 RepID=A0A7C4MTR6_9BACT